MNMNSTPQQIANVISSWADDAGHPLQSARATWFYDFQASGSETFQLVLVDGKGNKKDFLIPKELILFQPFKSVRQWLIERCPEIFVGPDPKVEARTKVIDAFNIAIANAEQLISSLKILKEAAESHD